MKRLSELTDRIYIHIDMDVLDPAEVSGHPLTVPAGPKSQDLAAALETMFRYEKACALGIASYPWENDKGLLSLKAAYALVEGSLRGVKTAGKKTAAKAGILGSVHPGLWNRTRKIMESRQ